MARSRESAAGMPGARSAEGRMARSRESVAGVQGARSAEGRMARSREPAARKAGRGNLAVRSGFGRHIPGDSPQMRRPGLPLSLATLVLLAAACSNQPTSRSTGAAPTGTVAGTGQPYLSPQATGPGGINRDYNIGGDPNVPSTGGSGRR